MDSIARYPKDWYKKQGNKTSPRKHEDKEQKLKTENETDGKDEEERPKRIDKEQKSAKDEEKVLEETVES